MQLLSIADRNVANYPEAILDCQRNKDDFMRIFVGYDTIHSTIYQITTLLKRFNPTYELFSCIDMP